MATHDPLSDLLTRIRNGHAAGQKTVRCGASKFLVSVLDVLKREGYIRSYSTETIRTGVSEVTIELKYYEEAPVISKLRRVSKLGRRIYAGLDTLPRAYNGLGIYILSTSKGVLSDAEAREQGVGGEVLCEVF